MTRPSARRLARALVERLAAVVPPPLAVRALGDVVEVSAEGVSLGGSAAAAIVEERDGRTDDERLETAIRAVLSGVQDCVCEGLALPWPVEADGAMALPDARVEDGTARLWYGTREDAAAIALPPLSAGDWTGP